MGGPWGASVCLTPVLLRWGLFMQESRHPGAGTYTGLQETDDYIDDAMDSYEASLEYQD
jgi:hypothetical protein